MKSSDQKPGDQKKSKLKILIGGLIFLAVYETALAVIAKCLLEKELREQ